jgi:MFS transporter, FHS family, Na+ dependent glucose transporter 1
MKSTNRTARVILPTIIFYLSFIVLGLTTAVTGPTLPTLAEHTSSRIDQISFIFIAGSLGYLLGTMFGGRLYDRIPGNRLIPLGLIILAASAACVPIASQLWILATAIFILGISQGVVDVGGNTLLIWVHGAGVGPYMNGLHLFFGIGALLSPILVAQIVHATGEINWVYWSFSVLTLPLAIWAWFLNNPERPKAAVSSERVKINVVAVAIIATLFFLYVGAEIGYGNWLYTYTLSLNLGTPLTAAYLTSAFWGFFTLGRLAGIPISTRVQPLKILFIDILGCLISAGMIILGSSSSTALWLGTILLGLSMASFFATLMTFADSKLHISGQVTGLFLVGAGLGGMFLPWFIGQSFSAKGPQTMPVILFVDLVVNLILLFVLAIRFRGLSKVEAGAGI